MKSKLILIIMLVSTMCFAQSFITQAEYFIDTDPGVGNATPIGIIQGVTIDQTVSLSTASVSHGIHILHIRVKNAGISSKSIKSVANLDNWGLYARHIFYKTPPVNTTNEIVAAEYFIDEDPGVGNGIPINITQGATIDQAVNILISDDLPAGNHILHIRAKSSNDKWSIYWRSEFDSALYNNEFDLQGLSIYPNPVEDVIHISSDNIGIEKITVFDINGKIILNHDYQSEAIDISKLVPGIYILRIKTRDGGLSKKIIKK